MALYLKNGGSGCCCLSRCLAIRTTCIRPPCYGRRATKYGLARTAFGSWTPDHRHRSFRIHCGRRGHVPPCRADCAVAAPSFVMGTVLGCFMHIQGHTLPWSRPAVALTVAVAAAVVGMHARTPISILAPLFAVAGAFHGYAYGESIVGAERAPLAAYVIGFCTIQYFLAVGSGAALRMIVGRDYLSETMAMRMAGGGLALLAAFALVNVALVG